MIRRASFGLALTVPIVAAISCGAPTIPPAGSTGPPSTATATRTLTATITPAEARPTASASSSPSASAQAKPIDPVFAVMTDVIRTSRPEATFELTPDRLDGSWILDGNLIDVLGRGRLYIVVTPRTGDLTARPCADPDFRQGGACAERFQSDGSRLVLRDRVTAAGVTTVLAIVIHRDRSGVTAESDDAAIDVEAPLIVDGDTPRLSRTRPAPPYTARELAELVVAIDRRLQEEGLP